MAILDLSLQLKVSVPCLLLGAILFGVSFSVDKWIKWSTASSSGFAGLWKACFQQSDVTYCYTWNSDTMDTFKLSRDWIHKSQALQCLGLVVMLGALGSTIVFIFIKLRLAVIAAVVTSFGSAAFMVIGCAVFASDVNDDAVYGTIADFDWAFGFNIVAAIFTTAAGVGLLLQTILHRTTTNTPT
ncbi:hypothetical protein BaRGS_00027873 [Batillaria attramentaria]|uniref:Claudin n=1 Tax=Batillaria attramentaria TaxID=370345 RepID=A0ABD0K1X5_9CAEN